MPTTQAVNRLFSDIILYMEKEFTDLYEKVNQLRFDQPLWWRINVDNEETVYDCWNEITDYFRMIDLFRNTPADLERVFGNLKELWNAHKDRRAVRDNFMRQIVPVPPMVFDTNRHTDVVDSNSENSHPDLHGMTREQIAEMYDRHRREGLGIRFPGRRLHR